MCFDDFSSRPECRRLLVVSICTGHTSCTVNVCYTRCVNCSAKQATHAETASGRRVRQSADWTRRLPRPAHHGVFPLPVADGNRRTDGSGVADTVSIHCRQSSGRVVDY